MADVQDPDLDLDDGAYDEDADSDFDATSVKSGGSQSSSDDEEDVEKEATARAKKRRKLEPSSPRPAEEPAADLDSGDEATIKEHKKERRKQRKRGEDVEDDDEREAQEDGWRARTRAMRERDKEEGRQNKLASIQGSTVDVDKLWEEMNRPLPLRAPITTDDSTTSDRPPPADAAGDKENVPSFEKEIITIRRTYKFAGEVHTEEKTVPKDSAEAKLWLAQQSSAKPQALDADGRMIQRPLRKISRFDPNYSNLEAFKGIWTLHRKPGAAGPKLNVVEKSKMDWAVHVDTEGLQEELSEAAKAKGSYLSRTDFLREVEHRQEEEARAARLRGL